MGITVSWADEDKTIVYIRLVDGWSMEERHALFNTIVARIRSVEHPVYTISDYTESSFPPLGFLRNYRRVAQLIPLNTKLSVVIARNGLMRDLVIIAARVYIRQLEVAVVKSIADAHTLIEKRKRSNRGRANNAH